MSQNTKYLLQFFNIPHEQWETKGFQMWLHYIPVQGGWLFLLICCWPFFYCSAESCLSDLQLKHPIDFILCSPLPSCSFQQDCDLARWLPTCSNFGDIIMSQMQNFVLLLIELHEVSANSFLWVSRHLFGLKCHISVTPPSVISRLVLHVITDYQQRHWTILAPKSMLGIFCWLLGTNPVLSHWSLPLQPRGATSLQPTSCSIHSNHVSSGHKLKFSGSSCQCCQGSLYLLLSLHPYSQSFCQRN